MARQMSLEERIKLRDAIAELKKQLPFKLERLEAAAEVAYQLGGYNVNVAIHMVKIAADMATLLNFMDNIFTVMYVLLDIPREPNKDDVN